MRVAAPSCCQAACAATGAAMLPGCLRHLPLARFRRFAAMPAEHACTWHTTAPAPAADPGVVGARMQGCPLTVPALTVFPKGTTATTAERLQALGLQDAGGGRRAADPREHAELPAQTAGPSDQ